MRLTFERARLVICGCASVDREIVRVRSLARDRRQNRRRLSESDLRRRLKAGDEDAATNSSIVTLHASAASLPLRSPTSAADADDILQETFIALAEALPFFRGDSSLFTFACAIAHRKVLSLIRTNARRARLMRRLRSLSQSATAADTGADREFNRALAELRARASRSVDPQVRRGDRRHEIARISAARRACGGIATRPCAKGASQEPEGI